MWPTTSEDLLDVQRALAARRPGLWRPTDRSLRIAACWVCFPRGVTGRGSSGDRAWVAAVLTHQGRTVARHVFRGTTGGPYLPGLLALRIGPLCERAVRSLDPAPDVVLLDATGRDHPRRAGLTVHLGAVLDLPTVGVTHRPLLAEGPWPADEAGASSPLWLDGEQVACWLRTRPGTRPLAVHAGWRTDLDTAIAVARRATARHRTPEPLRSARRLARRARAADHG